MATFHFSHRTFSLYFHGTGALRTGIWYLAWSVVPDSYLNPTTSDGDTDEGGQIKDYILSGARPIIMNVAGVVPVPICLFKSNYE